MKKIRLPTSNISNKEDDEHLIFYGAILNHASVVGHHTTHMHSLVYYIQHISLLHTTHLYYNPNQPMLVAIDACKHAA